MKTVKVLKRFCGAIAAVCLTLAIVPPAFAAAPVIQTDVSEASSGCVMLGVEGEYASQVDEALKRINEIRKEACKEHVVNPDTGKALTASDYVPIKWSSGLEYIARIRAAESGFTMNHARTNGRGWYQISAPDGARSQSEVIAWNYGLSMTQGIDQWYREKKAWVKKTDGMTGHYESLITPSNRYVGLGLFYSENAAWPSTTVGEFSGNAILDQGRNSFTGKCVQMLEINVANIKSYAVSGKKSVGIGSSRKLAMRATVDYLNGKSWFGGHSTTLKVMSPIDWSSSDEDIATVNSNGAVKALKRGSVRITAKANGVSKSMTLTCALPTTNTVGRLVYSVKDDGKTATAVVKRGVSKTLKSVTVPSSVEIAGAKCKVTGIASNAFKNNKSLAKVTIGKNLKNVGTGAFYGCKKLKLVAVKTKLLKKNSVGIDAFKSIHKKATFKMPKGKKSAYAKLFKNAGAPRTARAK